MKKLFRYILLSCTLLNLDLEAALPPFYQSVRELKQIIDSPEVASELGSAEPILDIQRNSAGYLITSLKDSVQVDIVYEAQEMPGPKNFHLIVHEKTER